MSSNPKNKAFKRVIETEEGAMKDNNSVPRGAMTKKGGGGNPRRVVTRRDREIVNFTRSRAKNISELTNLMI